MAKLKIAKRVSTALINSLRGVVPRVGLEHIAVGRKRKSQHSYRIWRNIAEGGAAFHFIVGHGSGKVYVQLLRHSMVVCRRRC